MAEKRKDSKGRVLRTGESQRKDGTYMYRYVDVFKKRKTIYAPTISELREKEDQIAKKMALGIMPSDVTVRMMIDRYEAMQVNLRAHTSKSYKNFGKIILKSELADTKIETLTASTIKLWLIKLYESGYAPGTVYQVCGYFKRVLNIAVEDNLINKNPISFRRDFLPEKKGKRDALTIKQQETLLDYVEGLPCREATYDYIVVLLGTGLRIGEFMGLTIGDLDFKNRIITVNKQMCTKGASGHYIAPVKTESGNRKIPMSDDVHNALERMIFRQKSFKISHIVDGYSGFVFIDSKGRLQNEYKFLCELKRITARYTKETRKPFPHVTPHVFRHTFCTNMANAGMPPVALQYLMGHTDASVTFGVYTHSSFENARKAFEKVAEMAVGE